MSRADAATARFTRLNDETVGPAPHARGHDVYRIDPYRLSHYRAGLGRRAKTDPEDAYLLARFLAREIGELRPWSPLPQGQQRFWQLLKRRSTLVRAKVQLRQFLTDMDTLQDELDVRVRQAGRWQGRRKLTKTRDGEIRRLFFDAAMQGRRNELWEPYYLRPQDRGLSSTAVFVALGRKLAKVCFALLKNDSAFDPPQHRTACMST